MMKEEGPAFPSEWARQLARQGREAGVAFVYLDQGQFAYSQEVRLPGQPVMGVAGARTVILQTERLPHLHLRPWWGVGGGQGQVRGERGGFYSLEGGGLHGGSVGRTCEQRSRLRTGKDDDSSGVWV